MQKIGRNLSGFLFVSVCILLASASAFCAPVPAPFQTNPTPGNISDPTCQPTRVLVSSEDNVAPAAFISWWQKVDVNYLLYCDNSKEGYETYNSDNTRVSEYVVTTRRGSPPPAFAQRNITYSGLLNIASTESDFYERAKGKIDRTYDKRFEGTAAEFPNEVLVDNYSEEFHAETRRTPTEYTVDTSKLKSVQYNAPYGILGGWRKVTTFEQSKYVNPAIGSLKFACVFKASGKDGAFGELEGTMEASPGAVFTIQGVDYTSIFASYRRNFQGPSHLILRTNVFAEVAVDITNDPALQTAPEREFLSLVQWFLAVDCSTVGLKQLPAPAPAPNP